MHQFLKLGVSLVTDKTRAYTARHERLARLASEVRQALDAAPDLRLVVGHGSGSFGHWAARPHGTRQGVHTPAQWRGYAEVAAAARLNRIVAAGAVAVGEAGKHFPPTYPSPTRAGSADGLSEVVQVRSDWNSPRGLLVLCSPWASKAG
jgi:isopentenyl phosphate kinase